MKITFPIPLIASILLASCSPEQSPRPKPDTTAEREQQQRRQIDDLQSQLKLQRETTDRWELLSGTLGVAALAMLILGTSLGAKTRHDAQLSTR